MSELIFEVTGAEEGGYCARALGFSIFTEAETLEELRQNVREAADSYFERTAKATGGWWLGFPHAESSSA